MCIRDRFKERLCDSRTKCSAAYIMMRRINRENVHVHVHVHVHARDAVTNRDLSDLSDQYKQTAAEHEAGNSNLILLSQVEWSECRNCNQTAHGGKFKSKREYSGEWAHQSKGRGSTVSRNEYG